MNTSPRLVDRVYVLKSRLAHHLNTHLCHPWHGSGFGMSCRNRAELIRFRPVRASETARPALSNGSVSDIG